MAEARVLAPSWGPRQRLRIGGSEGRNLRVIAGVAKGRPLLAPRGLALRPTTDKVKGAIFSMLTAEGLRRTDEGSAASDFPFPRVLDLFAGTGALGIEALSRGAEFVDFVESNARARAIIRQNLQRTGLAPKAAVHGLRVESAVSTFLRPYDLILLDPPYLDPTVSSVLAVLGRSVILAPRALVVVEHARTTELSPEAGTLHLLRRKYHGTTAISLFRHVEEAP